MTHDPVSLATVPPAPEFAQESFPPLPLCWRALNAQEHADQLGALGRWIGWLSDCYSLDHRIIPPCWGQHGALLEELSALWTAWRTAYASTSAGNAPLDWHVHFAASRQRLTDWVAKTGCRNGEHRQERAVRQPGDEPAATEPPPAHPARMGNVILGP